MSSDDPHDILDFLVTTLVTMPDYLMMTQLTTLDYLMIDITDELAMTLIIKGQHWTTPTCNFYHQSQKILSCHTNIGN